MLFDPMKKIAPLLLLLAALAFAGCREKKPGPFLVRIVQDGRWHLPDEKGFYNLKKDTFALIFYYRGVKSRNDTSITLDYLATFNPANFPRYDTAQRLHNLLTHEFGGRNTTSRNQSQSLTMDMPGGYSSLELNKQFHSYNGLRYTSQGVECTYFVGELYDCNIKADVPIEKLSANELRLRLAINNGKLKDERLGKLLKIRFK